MNSVNIARLLLGLLLLIQQVSLGATNSESEKNVTTQNTISSPSYSTSTTIPTTTTPTTTPTTTTPTTTPTTTTPTTTTPSTSTTETTTAAPTTTSAFTTTLPPTTTLPTTSLPKSTTVATPTNNKQTTADYNIDLKAENQRLKIAVGVLTAIIIVTVLFTVVIMYIRKRNNIDMRRHEKIPRPNYFRPISNLTAKKSQLDPALEHLQDDRLFVNDLDKEMKTFRLNRGGNVMTSEL